MNRYELHDLLVEISECKVYFQPPETLKITYPCIVYELNNIDIKHADDLSYLYDKSYTITYMSSDPDDITVDKLIKKIKKCKFDRRFVNDNIYHNVFTIYS